MSKRNNNNLQFLSPLLIIKNRHLNKNDVSNIKYSLLHKINFTCLVVAVLLLLVNLVSLFTMGTGTGWNQIEVYGLPSFIGQMTSFAGTTATITLTLISLFTKNGNLKNRLAHIGNILIFVVMIIYLFFSLTADVTEGFLSETPTLSASITLISFFLVIQPVFWIEAIILDGIVSVGLITLSIVYTIQYKMEGLMYYLFIAVFFPITSYVIISILFYAETQRYCEELRNEALYNTANYDELTQCKNRHALNTKIETASKDWEDDYETKLLVTMFDIDDFKLYNDQYSHIGGDYCLKAIADSIRKAFPSPSIDFYRYGGEEFLFFLEIKTKEEAKRVIETIRLAVSNLNVPAPKGAPCKNVTVSVGGVTIKAGNIKDFNEVIRSADDYLYQAKRSGKNISVLDGEVVK